MVWMWIWWGKGFGNHARWWVDVDCHDERGRRRQVVVEAKGVMMVFVSEQWGAGILETKLKKKTRRRKREGENLWFGLVCAVR